MHGFRVSFVIATGAVAVGLLMALFLPRQRPASKPQLRASSEEEAALERAHEVLGGFRGRVLSADGAPVARAKVTLIDRRGRQAGATLSDELTAATRSPCRRRAPTCWRPVPRATARSPRRRRTRATTARSTWTCRCPARARASPPDPRPRPARSRTPPSPARRGCGARWGGRSTAPLAASAPPTPSHRWRTPMPAAPTPEILAAFEAAKGFMPPDEGLALYEAAAEAGRLGLPLLEVGTYCGRSTILLADAARAAGRDRDHRRPPPRQRGAAAGLGVPRPGHGGPGDRPDGHPARLPPDPAPGGAGGARGRAGRPLPAGRRVLGRRRSAWSSSTAATPTSTRTPTTRAGRPMSRTADCSSSTTSSPTRWTSSPARRRTASTCGPWRPARSPRSR